MTGTSIDSPKLDSLEPAATAIYNKIGEVGGRWKTVGGKSRKHGRLISTQYFYFSDKIDFKKLSAAPSYTCLACTACLLLGI